MTGMVADIQHASIHDGPGLRTTVFLKGCPLHCAWCHNPECIDPQPQLLFYPEKCISCGKCAEGCFSGARVLCGKEWTVHQVLDEILRDMPYYGEIGGVTLSGGEPLFQPDFSRELLEECQKQNIHTALETSLFACWGKAEPVLTLCNLVMADIKIWEDDLHRQYTGFSNRLIIENISKLNKLEIPFILRTPIIPGINDKEETIRLIAEFAAGLHYLQYYELLPYHPLGLEKTAALGGEHSRFEIPGVDAMERLAKAAASAGIPVRISGKVVKLC